MQQKAKLNTLSVNMVLSLTKMLCFIKKNNYKYLKCELNTSVWGGR